VQVSDQRVSLLRGIVRLPDGPHICAVDGDTVRMQVMEPEPLEVLCGLAEDRRTPPGVVRTRRAAHTAHGDLRDRHAGRYFGTLCTPMSANFNPLPAALLDMKSRYGTIKAQIPTVIPYPATSS
jgi:hypothetical protein